MSGSSVISYDKKNKKNIFYRSRKPFNVRDIDVNKILISKEVVYGTKNSLKYFIGYIDEDDVIRLLLLRLPQMIGYLKEFNDSMTMSFRIGDSKLFKKYCKIKVKMYNNEANTNFQGKEIPERDASYKCLSLIMLYSIVKVGKKYHPQVLLEECKYIKRKNKMFN